MRPLYFLIIIFSLFGFNIQAQDSSDSKDHLLTEDGDFYKDQIVYYTGHGRWVDVTNNIVPEVKLCILTLGAPLKIVGFSTEQSIVIVEVLNPSSGFSCDLGDQFPVNKSSIRK